MHSKHHQSSLRTSIVWELLPFRQRPHAADARPTHRSDRCDHSPNRPHAADGPADARQTHCGPLWTAWCISSLYHKCGRRAVDAPADYEPNFIVVRTCDVAIHVLVCIYPTRTKVKICQSIRCTVYTLIISELFISFVVFQERYSSMFEGTCTKVYWVVTSQ